MTTQEQRPIPDRQTVDRWLHDERHWGRWGADDQRGAVNLITHEKRVAAASLVRSGESISLSRPFATRPMPGNPIPAQHFLRRESWSETSGIATDYYGVMYHGTMTTHIDALCHIWDEDGMWNGVQPDDVLTYDGSTWGGVDAWRDGIVTRGVLLDVPEHRGVECITFDTPVHGWELDEIVERKNLVIESGDAVVVYSGRDRWDLLNPAWGSAERPGLHASCLDFLARKDVAVLAWDMLDLRPNGYDMPWTVHGAIYAYGLALVDNCDLEALVTYCRAHDRSDFMFIAAPLCVTGGTGSPLNPLAVL